MDSGRFPVKMPRWIGLLSGADMTYSAHVCCPPLRYSCSQAVTVSCLRLNLRGHHQQETVVTWNPKIVWKLFKMERITQQIQSIRKIQQYKIYEVPILRFISALHPNSFKNEKKNCDTITKLIVHKSYKKLKHTAKEGKKSIPCGAQITQKETENNLKVHVMQMKTRDSAQAKGKSCNGCWLKTFHHTYQSE